jgi:hypothetical protein
MPKLSKRDQHAKVSQNEARRRKEVALARLREMEADERAAKLIRADLGADNWVKIVAAIKAVLLRMPDNHARQLGVKPVFGVEPP